MKATKTIKIITVILILTAITFFLIIKQEGISVKTYKAKRQNFSITVTATATGTIKAETDASISAQRAGRIEKLRFDEGSIVDDKSVIAELDSEIAFIELRLSEATLQKAKAKLSEMNTAFNAFKADVEAEISKNKAILIEAEKRLKRAKELIKQGFITEAELDLTEKEYAIAKASYESSEAKKSQVEAKLHEIKAQEAAVKEAEQSYHMAQLNYNYSFIRSPISGIVTSRKVKLGDTVSKGTILGTVVSPGSLYVEGLIDEADIANVSLGKEANITMDAYYGEIFKGLVYRISPVVTGGKQETRTFEVRIRLKDSPLAIKPGMSADVEIIVDKVENALVVPSQAIFEREKRFFLYVIRDSKANLTEVKTGRSSWTYTEILSGINEGDEIIINPDVPGLRDGVKVKK